MFFISDTLFGTVSSGMTNPGKIFISSNLEPPRQSDMRYKRIIGLDVQTEMVTELYAGTCKGMDLE